MINHYTLIIGSQKCGTTSLFNYLAQHPQIAPSRRKEANFFVNDEYWNRGFDWYHSLWQWNPARHRTALEASPRYTGSQELSVKAASRMSSIGEQLKLIYIMRNPIDKIDSARQQGYYQGWLKAASLDSVSLDLIEGARYAKQIDEYAQRFELEHLLLLQLEDLNRQPQDCLQQVCQFLELQPHTFQSLNKIHNARNSYREDTPWRKLSQLDGLKALAKRIPDRPKNYLRTVLTKPRRKDQAEIPALSIEQRQFIQRELKGDLVRLQLEYNVDISKWPLTK